jgi:glutathione S-transferase
MTGDDQNVHVELYCKPSASGEVGDCPFAHAVAMALVLRQVKFDFVPTSREAKPQWLLQKHDGSMPCLRVSRTETGACSDDTFSGSVSLSDSRAILEYIDAHLGAREEERGSLSAGGAAAALVDRVALFPAFARYCKNTDDVNDTELRGNMNAALLRLEDELTATAAAAAAAADASAGSFALGGTRATVADCLLGPTLLHMHATLEVIKGTPLDSLLEPFPKAEAYCRHMLQCTPLVQSCRYSEADVLLGWRQARGEVS